MGYLLAISSAHPVLALWDEVSPLAKPHRGMFEDVVVAAQFRALHAGVGDALLDEAARMAGCASGIGRLSLLSDEMLARISARLGLREDRRVLDIGCGRGFLERWLRYAGCAARATGIDRAPGAIAAARRHCPEAEFMEADYRTQAFEPEFGAVAALELSASGKLPAALLTATARALCEGGVFCFTAASLDGRHEQRLNDAEPALRERFSDVEILDATRDAGAFAQRLYGACLQIDQWNPEIRPRIVEQAHAVLEAIDRGDFHYAIAFGRR